MSLIQKYIWVVKTIHRAGRITLRELNEKWLDNVDLSGGLDLQRQTFDRWKGSILDIFGIVIDCEQCGRYNYFIANPKVLERGEMRTWLLNTYGTVDALSNSLSIHDRILTEDVPSSQNFLTTVLEAMKTNSVLKVTHQSFGKNETNTFAVEPYCVKMSAQRWYLLARNVDKNYLRLYALDRLIGVEMTDASSTCRRASMPRNFSRNTLVSCSTIKCLCNGLCCVPTNTINTTCGRCLCIHRRGRYSLATSMPTLNCIFAQHTTST